MELFGNFTKSFRWLLVLLFLIACSYAQANAQDASNRCVTWDELKRVQAEERAQLQAAQKKCLIRLSRPSESR